MSVRKEKYDMLAVVGPTASGKTSLAVDIALEISGAEIISADSRQVYRGMDIGTGTWLNMSATELLFPRTLLT